MNTFRLAPSHPSEGRRDLGNCWGSSKVNFDHVIVPYQAFWCLCVWIWCLPDTTSCMEGLPRPCTLDSPWRVAGAPRRSTGTHQTSQGPSRYVLKQRIIISEGANIRFLRRDNPSSELPIIGQLYHPFLFTAKFRPQKVHSYTRQVLCLFSLNAVFQAVQSSVGDNFESEYNLKFRTSCLVESLLAMPFPALQVTNSVLHSCVHSIALNHSLEETWSALCPINCH